MSDSIKRHYIFMQKIKQVIFEYERYRREVEGDDVLLKKIERVTKDGFTTVWMTKKEGSKDAYISNEGTLREHRIT